MSGLFTRLARRARGADLGAVRLLVPTPYEADSPRTELTDERAGESVAAEPAGTEAVMATRHGSPERNEVPGGDATGVEALVSSRAPSPSQSTTTPSPAGFERESVETKAREPARIHVEGHAVRPVRLRLPSREPLGSERAAHAVHDDASPSLPRGRGGGTPGSTAWVSRDDAVPRARLDEQGSTARDTDTSDDPPLLAPVPRRRSSTADLRGDTDHSGNRVVSEPRPQADARPVVRVTIGRIDVRGPSPSPQTPRPAPARHQPLGLDEYLRRRDQSGGGSP